MASSMVIYGLSTSWIKRAGVVFMSTHRLSQLVFACLIFVSAPVLVAPNQLAFGQEAAKVKARCIALELYIRSSEKDSSDALEIIQKYVGEKRGVRIRIYDLDKTSESKERLEQIATAYKVPATKLPYLYGMNQVFNNVANPNDWKRRIDDLLLVQIYTRRGCSRCARAKEYLPSFQAKYPGLQIQILDVITDPGVNQQYNDLANSQRIGGISFPGFWMCKQLIVGFDSEQITAPRLEAALKKWTFECELAPTKKVGWRPTSFGTFAGTSIISGRFSLLLSPTITNYRQEPRSPPTDEDEAPPPLPITGEDDPPPLEIGDPSGSPPLDIAPGDTASKAPLSTSEEDAVEVPYLGRLSAKQLGMPLFTILIGLVDGFNPCAMWVLMFLLSVLVNLKDRWKILAVAGTFVVISGVAYFAFMAAWLNVLLLVGFLRWVQLILATLAIIVGSIHVKDFFAFKKGISLSIPESAKPGIYSRVRKIVLAESLVSAIGGATVLAILVNIIELLCTAGLPAMYSQVLSLQDYPVWKNYAYLGLYILAYMFDDSIMVAIVVITLGRKKLQETQGRWLKLVSGLVILLLGLVLLLKPEWLE
jgi:glutaredoxin